MTDREAEASLREQYDAEDRFLKRLRKKARKGLRGWPIATIAFYGPNLSQATKVTVGIVPSENAEVNEMRDWKVDRGDIRADGGVARGDSGIYRAASSVIGRDDRLHNRLSSPRRNRYEGEWCPACEFWHGRDRFIARTDEMIE